MAGNYPDVSAKRMAIDKDGSQFFRVYTSGSVVELTAGEIANICDETSATAIGGAGEEMAICVIFAELRDLDGFLMSVDGTTGGFQRYYAGPVSVSSNTTNGLDGTWTVIRPWSDDTLGDGIVLTATKPQMRTAVYWTTSLNVKAVKLGFWGSGSRILDLHLYGKIKAGETPKRLELWHPTLDQSLSAAYFDWGDIPRNSTETRSFRIKNMHSTLTSNGVRAAMSALTDTSPSVVGQMALSQDGGSTWAAQQTLSAPLAPGAISPVLQIRRNTASNATLSLWWSRVFADATSWS